MAELSPEILEWTLNRLVQPWDDTCQSDNIWFVPSLLPPVDASQD